MPTSQRSAVDPGLLCPEVPYDLNHAIGIRFLQCVDPGQGIARRRWQFNRRRNIACGVITHAVATLVPTASKHSPMISPASLMSTADAIENPGKRGEYFRTGVGRAKTKAEPPHSARHNRRAG